MIPNAILTLTGITTGLIAGLFFAWSYSVIPGLAKLPDASYIAAMQSMNRAIQNPVFFSCFFGAALLLPLSTCMHYGTTSPAVFWLLLSATVLYLDRRYGHNHFWKCTLK